MEIRSMESSFIELWKSDVYRYTKDISTRSIMIGITTIPGAQFSFFLRSYHSLLRPKRYMVYRVLVARIYVYLRFKYGMEISPLSMIGPGLYIPHCGNIVVHNEVTIGSNCTISNGVTIGKLARGNKKGVPVIGNNVYIAPGAKIFGRIQIGDNALIGANTVVLDDIPPNAVVIGNPSTIASFNGADGYNVNLWSTK